MNSKRSVKSHFDHFDHDHFDHIPRPADFDRLKNVTYKL